jgi:hypothetical protein
VSLYYGAYFAANAVCSMFGALIDGDKIVVEADLSNPGAIQLRLSFAAGKKPLPTPTGHHGSHRAFWDFFYSGSAALVPWVEPAYEFALKPVQGDVTWQIARRNDVNYDPFVAVDLASQFIRSFDPSKSRATMSGALATQLEVTEALVFVACRFAAEFGLASGSLAALSPGGTRADSIRDVILTHPGIDIVSQFDVARLTV